MDHHLYLKPVYNYFHRELLKRHFLMADDPVKVVRDDRIMVISAGKVKEADYLRTGDRDEELLCIQMTSYGDTVYNLVLEEGNFFFANGIEVGDVQVQIQPYFRGPKGE